MEDIIVLFAPSITLAELKVDNVRNTDGQKVEQRAGDYYPVVSINTLIFPNQNLLFFKLSVEGFLPTISVSVSEMGQNFINKFYPMDGDVISILIKSKNPDFQSIRQDFRITNINSSNGSDGQNVYTISGVLDIPQLYVDKIISFKDMTSIDTLKKIAKELKLGFATNVKTMSDKMTRYCPNTDYLDFILNDVMVTSYRDDDSFFTCFIDQYYNLNFVEVNNLLVGTKKAEATTIATALATHNPDDNKPKTEEAKLILTNSVYGNFGPNKVEAYTLLNNTGEISLTNGYRTFLHYYDKKKQSSVDFFIETLNDNATNNTRFQRGRDDEDQTKQLRSLYFGNLHTDNVFQDYYAAKVQNSYNNSELQKINLWVTLGEVNPNLTRYKVVPVAIINRDRMYEIENTNNTNQYSVNELITDFYCLSSMEYIYDGSSHYMNTILTKREFSRPNRTSNDKDL